MDRKNKKAAVALSGGVDSAVAALLLKNQGYEVIGITGKMVNSPGADKVCENAKIVADKLGIQHYIYDVTENFEEKIIKYFENSYATGKTPNPCIMILTKTSFISCTDLTKTSFPECFFRSQITKKIR